MTQEPAPGSYLDFLARTRPPLTDAILQLRHPFPDHATALGAFDGYRRLLRVIGHHARLLAGLAPSRHPTDHLGPSLRHVAQQFDAVHLNVGDITTPDPSTPWAETACWLATAHDVIAAHFGPERQPRTPQASTLTVEVVADYAAPLGELAATAADAAPLLAMRIHENCARENLRVRRVRRAAVTLLDAGPALHRAARQLTVQNRTLTEDATDLQLPPDPRLPEITGNPLSDAATHLQMLALLTHRQAHGQLPAGPGAIHGMARLGHDVLAYCQLVHTAIPSLPAGSNHNVTALAEARARWGQLRRELSRVQPAALAQPVIKSPLGSDQTDASNLERHLIHQTRTALRAASTPPSSTGIAPNPMLIRCLKSHCSQLLACLDIIGSNLTDVFDACCAQGELASRNIDATVAVEHAPIWRPIDNASRRRLRRAIVEASHASRTALRGVSQDHADGRSTPTSRSHRLATMPAPSAPAVVVSLT